ncbi:hypothetical protein V1264_003123 [Littorina saxatilis]|uniref:Uncharacterized protein n=1 Tax=Littorina saxatilis TaxID=31220 RepID=A0AAN9B425_9CAEN
MNPASGTPWKRMKTLIRRVNQGEYLTPFEYLSSGAQSPVYDRDDCPDSSVEMIPPVQFTSKTSAERTTLTSSDTRLSGYASPIQADHQRSVSSPVEGGKPKQAGHQRSVSSPANTSTDRHQDISCRMSELQRQLQGRKGEPRMYKMHSQGDLNPGSIKPRSQIADLIGQLSNRLKERDSLGNKGEERRLEHNQDPFSLYRSQSEPMVASMKQEKLAESPRVPHPYGKDPARFRSSLAEKEGEEEKEEEDSFLEEADVSNVSVADHKNVYLEESSWDHIPEEAAFAQHVGKKMENPLMHVAPPTPSVSRLLSGHPGNRGGRPDKIKEELRLCLDFLDDLVEDLDSEEEKEKAENVVKESEDLTQISQGVAQHVLDAQYMDTCSCSSNYDISPPPGYSETDDFAEDQASYTQRVSAYFSEDSFSKNHPVFESAWDRDRAASMPDILDKDVPFMANLLKSAMARPSSPPLPPPPPFVVDSSPSITPPPPIDAFHTPPVTPPPPVPSMSPTLPPPVSPSNVPLTHPVSCTLQATSTSVLWPSSSPSPAPTATSLKLLCVESYLQRRPRKINRLQGR